MALAVFSINPKDLWANTRTSDVEMSLCKDNKNNIAFKSVCILKSGANINKDHTIGTLEFNPSENTNNKRFYCFQ